jgi:hypothetical protein
MECNISTWGRKATFYIECNFFTWAKKKKKTKNKNKGEINSQEKLLSSNFFPWSAKRILYLGRKHFQLGRKKFHLGKKECVHAEKK